MQKHCKSSVFQIDNCSVIIRPCPEVLKHSARNHADRLHLGESFFLFQPSESAFFLPAACGCDLAQGGFFVRQGDYICTLDYQRLYGTRCFSCDEFIEGEVVSALGKTYHPDCFVCAVCRYVFSEVVFFLKIDFERPMPGIQIDSIWMKNCYIFYSICYFLKSRFFKIQIQSTFFLFF